MLLLYWLLLRLVFAQCPSSLKEEYYVVEITNTIYEITSCENGRSGNMLVTLKGKPGWVYTVGDINAVKTIKTFSYKTLSSIIIHNEICEVNDLARQNIRRMNRKFKIDAENQNAEVVWLRYCLKTNHGVKIITLHPQYIHRRCKSYIKTIVKKYNIKQEYGSV